jgi:hypothetical protein
MLIMSDAKWIGRVPPGHVNSLDGSLSLGLQKKQNSVALSMAEAEYITAGSCCAQLLLVFKIAYNPFEHSRTKHIDIRHHFLRDHVIKGDIVISHVGTNDQLADIFTKPLD